VEALARDCVVGDHPQEQRDRDLRGHEVSEDRGEDVADESHERPLSLPGEQRCVAGVEKQLRLPGEI
jgi:hypothetical protein